MLQHVAFGKQDEAEKLFTDNPDIAQELLTRPSTLTDYSGRTFGNGDNIELDSQSNIQYNWVTKKAL